LILVEVLACMRHSGRVDVQGSTVDLGLPSLADNGHGSQKNRPVDMMELAKVPRVCFQLDVPLNADWTQLFADDLFEFGLPLPQKERAQFDEE